MIDLNAISVTDQELLATTVLEAIFEQWEKEYEQNTSDTIEEEPIPYKQTQVL